MALPPRVALRVRADGGRGGAEVPMVTRRAESEPNNPLAIARYMRACEKVRAGRATV